MSGSPAGSPLPLMCYRQHRVVVNEDLENEGNVPAPLNLPFGKLFFGFNIPPYVPPPAPEEAPVLEVCVFDSPSNLS